MQLRYAYRLDPTPAQRRALARAFGCARVVFNDAVAARRNARETGAPYPSDAALSTALTAAKRTPARAWLAEVSAVVLQQALADANTAYRNFFASLKGTRKGRKLGVPRFRSRRDRAQSIRFTKAARFRVTAERRLRLPGIGDVPVRWSRALPGGASSVTVTVDAAGRYHCSFVVEAPDAPLPPVSQEVGIDLGLTHFAVLSDGTKVDAPQIARKAAVKLRTALKELARRQRAVRTGRSHAGRSPAPMPGWRTRGVTGCTSCPPPWFGRTNWSPWRTWPSRGWRARAWPGRCTTPDGRGSSACSPTRRSGPGGRS